MDLIPTLLAVLAVVLFLAGLGGMTVGSYTMAGMSFFSASIVLYFRETRGKDDGQPA